LVNLLGCTCDDVAHVGGREPRAHLKPYRGRGSLKMLILAIREANFHKAGELSGVRFVDGLARRDRDDQRSAADR
jgi:hypothetical protein